MSQRTVVVSDLHLGSPSALLSAEPARAALAVALTGASRIVLLGDILELRRGPMRDAVAAGRAILGELSGAFAGAEVVLVAGNHDHALIGGWLERRRAASTPESLGLEQRMSAAVASWGAQALAQALPDSEVSVAYPGIWLADDVYATHGHYLDCHSTLPTFERLAVGMSRRLLGAPPGRAPTPDDYERLLEPVYALIHAAAQHAGPAVADGASARAWRALAAPGRRPLRARALAGALPLAIGALNRAGLGPLRADLSPAEMRGVGVRGMAEVVQRLAIGARHVVFGHTHRAGPLPDDGPAAEGWHTPGGTALHNCGCWVYERGLLARGPESPFWPGACVVIEDGRAPCVQRLLGGSAATGPLAA